MSGNVNRPVESKTRTHHGRVGSGGARRGVCAGRARQDGTPTGMFAQETTVTRSLQGIEDNCPEHLFGSTDKGKLEHALREKGLQRQKGVDPMVSSQEVRALLVPVVTRSLTARCVPLSVYIAKRLFVRLERSSGVASSMPWGSRNACFLGELFCRHPVLPGPAPLPVRLGSNRPWYVRVLDSTGPM